MFHLVTLLATLLWPRPVVNMNVSDIHSDDDDTPPTAKGLSVTEEEEKKAVESTSRSHSPSPSANFKSSSVDADTNNEDIIENEPASEKEPAIDILKEKASQHAIEILEAEESEHCLIDLTTLLPQEENTSEDDISISKVIHHKSNPLAELMAKRKRNKRLSRKKSKLAAQQSSAADSSDNSLKDLVSRSRKYAEDKNRSPSSSRSDSRSRSPSRSNSQVPFPVHGSSEKRHHSRISDALSGKPDVRKDENPRFEFWDRSESPPRTSDESRRDSGSPLLSPTYKRKKRSSSSVKEDPGNCIELSTSSSEEDSPHTPRRKLPQRTLPPREWECTPFGWEYGQKRNEYPGVDFTIMSYNLLAQDLLQGHQYLYTYCDSEVLLWEYRRDRIMEEIDRHLPDIMCFQEVQSKHYDDFLKPKLEERGYIGIYCRKSHQSDGCATFFKVMKFDLLEFRQVFYLKGEVLDRGNVGLIVSLKPKSSDPNLESSKLYIGNTHLLFNPKRGDVKLAQLILFLAELDKAAYKYRTGRKTVIYHPTILCGDLNIEPFSRIYKLIVSRNLRYEGLLIRELAGMSEDHHFGRSLKLSRNFFPKYLIVSESCQFMDTVRERRLKEASKSLKEPSPSPADQLQTTEVKPSVSAETPQTGETTLPPGYEDLLTPLGSGEVSHFFNFVSTYGHEVAIGDRRHFKVGEVTSYHERTCGTMDYIFYNVDNKSRRRKSREVDNSVPEGRLKLLRRYRLYNTEEVRNMDRLPCAELGSDHFSLLAHFLLT